MVKPITSINFLSRQCPKALLEMNYFCHTICRQKVKVCLPLRKVCPLLILLVFFSHTKTNITYLEDIKLAVADTSISVVEERGVLEALEC